MSNFQTEIDRFEALFRMQIAPMAKKIWGEELNKDGIKKLADVRAGIDLLKEERAETGYKAQYLTYSDLLRACRDIKRKRAMKEHEAYKREKGCTLNEVLEPDIPISPENQKLIDAMKKKMR